MNEKLQKRIDNFRLKLGRPEALSRLIEAGLSKSMADKLLSGCYQKNLGHLYLGAIDKALGQNK